LCVLAQSTFLQAQRKTFGESMAPIFTAAAGVIPQIVDDERLRELRNHLVELELRVPLRKSHTTPEDLEEPLGINRLISLLEPWQSWEFEEQVSSFACVYLNYPRRIPALKTTAIRCTAANAIHSLLVTD
jgi:hypothetical protein